MEKKGQAALEYLMTYGWALIVIAIVIGILIYVTSTTGGGVTCVSQNNSIILKESTFSLGTDAVGFTLQNATGGTITLVDNCVTSCDGTGITDCAGTAECTAGTVAAGSTFTVTTLDGPATAGNVTGATATVLYTTEGTLPATAKIVCNGTI